MQIDANKKILFVNQFSFFVDQETFWFDINKYTTSSI